MEKIKVLYIAGSMRSGTTLMGRLLGLARGFSFVGELYNIWKAGLTMNLLCGCGRAFMECDFWGETIRSAFNGTMDDSKNQERAIKLQKSLCRLRKAPFLGFGRLNRELKEFGKEYLYPLYSSIREVGGNNMIVDSSKSPQYLYLLSKCDFIDLYVLHMVRDSRAVAYSWKRKLLRPEFRDRKEHMEIYSNLKSSKRWLLAHLPTLFFKRYLDSDKYMLLRYEDLALNPRETVGRVLEFAGADSDLSFFIDSNRVELGKTHSVLGNPMRFKEDLITDIIYDDEWKKNMKLREIALTSVMTYPLMRKLYYRNAPQGARGSEDSPQNFKGESYGR